MKKVYINQNYINLLNNKEYKSALKFEATYAYLVKGGYQPQYLGKTQQKRLVNDINLLNTSELKSLIQTFPIYSN